jgi:tRNA (guanosine-2'-O-)-methyltransferase
MFFSRKFVFIFSKKMESVPEFVKIAKTARGLFYIAKDDFIQPSSSFKVGKLGMSGKYATHDLEPIHKNDNLVCILEHCKNPGNIGSVMRNVDAFGIGVLFIITDNPLWLRYFSEIQIGRNPVIPHECKRLHKVLCTTSKGCNQWMKCNVFESTEKMIDFLNLNHFTCLATSPHQYGLMNVDLGKLEVQDKKIAIWFGSESVGLSKEAIDNCLYCVQIPIVGNVESLNLACSTAIVFNRLSTILAKNCDKNCDALNEDSDE